MQIHLRYSMMEMSSNHIHFYLTFSWIICRRDFHLLVQRLYLIAAQCKIVHINGITTPTHIALKNLLKF